MKKQILSPGFLSLAILLGLLSLQHSAHSQDHPVAVGSAFEQLMGSMDIMHVAMSSVRPSGDNDVDFVALMLPHHEAALSMAKTELVNGVDPQMRRLAQEIIADQQSEIQLMQLWSKQHQPGHRPVAGSEKRQ
jgi:uncharacterized protein (DUF305 family)